MAIKLSKLGIDKNKTILAAHVTQSVDALAAPNVNAYDISISGSLAVTGSITGTPSTINQLTASYAMNVAEHGSYWTSSGANISRYSDVIVEGSITSSGDISASGDMYGITGSFGELDTTEYLRRTGDPDSYVRLTNNRLYINAYASNPILTMGNSGPDEWFQLLAKRINFNNPTSNPMLHLNDNLGSITAYLNITASQNISASGDVYGVTGSFSHLAGNSPIVVGDPTTFQQPVTASEIEAEFFIGDGSQLTNLPTSVGSTVWYDGGAFATSSKEIYITGSIFGEGGLEVLENIRSIEGSLELDNGFITAGGGAIGIGQLDPSYELNITGSGDVKAKIESSTGNALLQVKSANGFNSFIDFDEGNANRYVVGVYGADNEFVISSGSLLADKRFSISHTGQVQLYGGFQRKLNTWIYSTNGEVYTPKGCSFFVAEGIIPFTNTVMNLPNASTIGEGWFMTIINKMPTADLHISASGGGAQFYDGGTGTAIDGMSISSGGDSISFVTDGTFWLPY